MKNILIKKIEEKDIPDVVDIQINSWQTTYKDIIDANFLNSMDKEQIVERRKKDYQNTLFIVAKLDNEIVGFCRYIDNNNATKEYDDIDCEIIALYVKNNYKRHGIGKQMFDYVLNEFKEKNKTKMIIWCLKENYPSRKFYEAMGGKIKGEHKINFGDKEYDEVGFEFLI